MDIILIFILIIIGMFFLGIFTLIFIFRKDIALFLWPGRYAEVTMIELDDNIFRDIIKKTEGLTWEFNGQDYNLFYPDKSMNEPIRGQNEPEPDYLKRLYDYNEAQKKKSTVFRSGRVASFTYIEGQQDPIDFRDLKRSYNQDSKIKKEMTKVDLTRMVTSVSDFNDFLDRYKTWILLGIAIVILILLFRKPTLSLDPKSAQILADTIRAGGGLN